MCIVSKDIDINKEKEICLPKKESISSHRYEGINMTVKCDMFKNFRKKTSWEFANQKTNLTAK